MVEHLSRKFFFLLLILSLFAYNFVTAESQYSIAICSNTTKINQNDNLTFYIYFIGVGNISADYLIFYIDSDVYIGKSKIMGIDTGTFGLQNQGMNVQISTDIIKKIKIVGSINSTVGDLNPLAGPLYEDNKFVRPFELTLVTTKDAQPGDRTLKVVFVYKIENGSWEQTSEIMNFHINTFTEQYEWIGFLWTFSVPFIGAFIGLFIALYIYRKTEKSTEKKEKKQNKKLKSNLTLMIRKEIEFNLPQISGLKNLNSLENLPITRAKTENKAVAWENIVKFWDKNYTLLNKISELYFLYDFLNRFLDTNAQNSSDNILINSIRLDEMKRQVKDIEEKSKAIIEQLGVRKQIFRNR